MAIAYSLSCAYFVYTFVFRIKFFPFMNVLTGVIAVGVGADDTFILFKAWSSAVSQHQVHHSPTADGGGGLLAGGLESEKRHLSRMVRTALKHSVATMFVTSLTTAAAFFSSLVSNITAIKCFR